MASITEEMVGFWNILEADLGICVPNHIKNGIL